MEAGGYESADEGFHTAMRRQCSGCGVIKSILPMRHWRPVKPETPKNLAPQKWPADEDRIDIIGQNGNDGEHYCGIIGGND